MSFQPTPEERRKYADYDVVIKDAEQTPVHVDVIDGQVIRMLCLIRRWPRPRRFQVIVFQGVSERERALVERWARELPQGGWAQFPDLWFRHRNGNGYVYFSQSQGVRAPDPFAQLELELMIDAGSEVHA